MRRCLLGVLVCLCVWFAAAVALAQTPIIEARREADVLALFQPYKLGAEVIPGWKLWNVSIGATEISVEVRGPGESPQAVNLLLTHSDDRPPGHFDSSKSFTFSFPAGTSGAGKDAALVLVAAVKSNDREVFWRSVTNVPPPRSRDREFEWTRLSQDPLLQFALFVALVVWMLGADMLRMAPRQRAWLLAVLAMGAALRLTIVKPMALDAWPFSRVPPLANGMFSGSIMAAASEGHVFFLTDYIYQVGLVCGLLGPAVVFLHARRMLGSNQAGILAAFLLAIWPSHLRFSHADGTFIASIVFSGMAFALTYDALRHPNRNWRWCALGALIPVLLTALSQRPLNQIFAVLLVGVAVWLPGEAPRWRRGLVAGVIALTTILLSVPEFLARNAGQVKSGLTPALVTNSLVGFFSYEYNTLLRVDITPPVGVLLAAVGVWALWRSNRRAAIFLVLWFGGFFATHSYILAKPPLMQARYHLHIIIPVILLAAAGGAHLLEQRRRLAQGALGVLAFAPLLHLGFIRDSALNEPTEHQFVHSLRPLIPAGCSIVEYVGQRKGDERFKRVGAQLLNKQRDFRFKVLSVETQGSDVPALLSQAEQSGCARLYLGIECYVDGEPEAPVCAQLRAAASSTIRELEIDNRVYDANNRFKNPDRQRFRMGFYSLDK